MEMSLVRGSSRKDRIVNNRDTFGSLVGKSAVFHIPESHGVLQTRKDILHARPCIAVLQPAQLNHRPQLVAEPKPFRLLRFPRPNPLHDRISGHNIRRELKVGVVPAQDLANNRLNPFTTTISARVDAHLIDDHPHGVAIGLPRRSIVFRRWHPKPFRIKDFWTHPPTSSPASKRHKRVV